MTRDQKAKDRHRFGGNTLVVFARDGYQCVSCSMTMDQHLARYNKRLTINHIDGTGRYKMHKKGTPEKHKVVNNDLNNLETLCLPCHGKKDGIRTTRNQHGKYGKMI